VTRSTGPEKPNRIRNQFGTFAQIPADLVKDPSISDRAIRVYALLWTYSSEKDRDAFPSRAQMAEDMEVSKSTIDRGIGELTRRGAISVEEVFDGPRQTSNLYTIIAPLPPRPDIAEVIHRGRKSAARGASNLRPSGAANLRPQEQEPEEQEISGPVPEVTTDASDESSGTGPKPSPALLSPTYGLPLHPATVFTSVGSWLPRTFDDAQLAELASEIVAAARPSRVFDPTAYVIRAIRNTVDPSERRRGRWLLRADEIAAEHAELAARGARF
jgi:hypothetical protein